MSDPHKFDYFRKDPIEDTFRPATNAQLNFIQILSRDLEFSSVQRDAHIADIIGKPFKWIDISPGFFSLPEACKVIAQFKDWKYVSNH